jgi:class I lanthipeptide synthase
MDKSTATTWTPILEGREAAAVWETIESVTRALESQEDSWNRQSTLVDGRPGPAIFLAYLAMATGAEHPRRRSLELIEQAVDGLSGAKTDTSMMAGFTGVAWAVEHLQGRAWERADEDLNEDTDEIILETLRAFPPSEWPYGHDLLYGLTGVGVYALERLPRASAAEILRQVIERLDRMGERSEEGLAWLSPSWLMPKEIRGKYLGGFYSLGVAHGPPGIVGLLAMAHAAGIEQERVRSMLEEAVRWLLARRIPDARGSSFASFHPQLGSQRARSGWCYGNPAIAISLMIAAHALGDKTLEETAHELALETVRRPHEDAGVVDPGLCHGAAGLGHLLNRLYQATGDDRIREEACFWIKHAIRMRSPSQRAAGFQSLRADTGDTEPVWKPDSGFLTGASGIGLALLASVTNVPPDWDRVLLANLPPAAARGGSRTQ